MFIDLAKKNLYLAHSNPNKPPKTAKLKLLKIYLMVYLIFISPKL